MESTFYETIDHTADIGILVKAKDVNSLYKNAALAFFDLLTGLEKIEVKKEITLHAEGSDLEELMVNWLSELLFLFDSEGWLFRDFQLELQDTSISATAMGETFDPEKHEIYHYIKAVTYHMLEVKKDERGWVARVIFDI